jgi:predicted nucleic acid-binding protein
VLIALERGDVTGNFLGDSPGLISVISVTELFFGVHRARSPQRTRRRIAVERILGEFDALPIDEEIARVHADVGAELAADGHQISTNDLWIGCTALVYDATVATRDQKSFSRIPGLRVLAA